MLPLLTSAEKDIAAAAILKLFRTQKKGKSLHWLRDKKGWNGGTPSVEKRKVGSNAWTGQGVESQESVT